MTNPVKKKYPYSKIYQYRYPDNTAKHTRPLHVALTVQSRWRPPGIYLTRSSSLIWTVRYVFPTIHRCRGSFTLPTVTTEFTPERTHPGRWILLDLTQVTVFHLNPVLTVREILGLGFGAPCIYRRLLSLLVRWSGAGRRWYAEQRFWGFCAAVMPLSSLYVVVVSVFLKVFGFLAVSCSFLWVEFGWSPEMFYFTNDMFSVFWFWIRRVFFWSSYVSDWNVALGWAESMNVVYVPAPLVCLLQLSSDGYCRDAISGC
jgi:hypothetical protein